MFIKFWDKLSEGLGQKWATQKMGFALAFWVGGALSWIACHDLGAITAKLTALDSTPIYIAMAVGGLMLLAASAAVVEWLERPLIRLLEGYWPGQFRRWRFKLAKRLEEQLKEKDARWSELEPLVQSGASSPEQQEEYARLDDLLTRYPQNPANLMPTTLGNLLRAAEDYPIVRYGLSITVCWPRLWLVLPAETRDALSKTREQLNAAARMALWGVLFFTWMIWSKWAALPAVVLIVSGYLRMIGAAGLYGDLLRATFDLHRFALYESLHWPLPTDPESEIAAGSALTEYLFRGTGGGSVRFSHAPENVRTENPGT